VKSGPTGEPGADESRLANTEDAAAVTFIEQNEAGL
jgi:hypothetical protein